MRKSHISRRIAVAVLASAFAVVVAAPAQADSPPHGLSSGYEFEYFGPGTIGVDGASVPVRPDDRADRAIASAAQPSAVRPDDRAFRAWGPVPVVAPVRPDDRADRRLPHGDGGIATDPILIVGDDKGNVPLGVNYAPTLVSTPNGFDWGDAGIGAATAFGLALLAGMSIAGLRYRRAAAVS
jgi:hypothetical protein